VSLSEHTDEVEYTTEMTWLDAEHPSLNNATATMHILLSHCLSHSYQITAAR